MRRILWILILITELCWSNRLFAQPLDNDSITSVRINHIQMALQKSASGVNRWWYGWLGAYSISTTAQAVIGFNTSDKNTRQDMLLGSATCMLGAGLQLATPLNTGSMAKEIAQLPDSTPELRTLKLRQAEELFRRAAETEKNGRSLKIQALNGAANLGSGLITWLGFRRSVWDGVSNFLINTVISELQIWTQPTRTLKDYHNYSRKYLEHNVHQTSKPEYLLRTYPGGVALNIVF